MFLTLACFIGSIGTSGKLPETFDKEFPLITTKPRSKYLTTGYESFDIALGGEGLPIGLVEVYGAPAVGKTLLALDLCKAAQRERHMVTIIDMDKSLSVKSLRERGLNLNLLIHVNAAQHSWEQTLDLAAKLAQNSRLIVIDSIFGPLDSKADMRSLVDKVREAGATLLVTHNEKQCRWITELAAVKLKLTGNPQELHVAIEKNRAGDLDTVTISLTDAELEEEFLEAFKGAREDFPIDCLIDLGQGPRKVVGHAMRKKEIRVLFEDDKEISLQSLINSGYNLTYPKRK